MLPLGTFFDVARDDGRLHVILHLREINALRQGDFSSALRFLNREIETVRPTLDGGRNLEAVEMMAGLEFKRTIASDGLRYAQTMSMLVYEILIKMTRVNVVGPISPARTTDRLFLLFEMTLYLLRRGENDVRTVLEYLTPEIRG